MDSALLESINQSCEGSVTYGIDRWEVIPSGIPQLDEAIGGIPRGRIVEIHGAAGSGKTALALHLAKQLGGPVLYADADHGLSPYIVQNQELYLLNVDALEDVLNACWIAAGGGFAAIVLDTVAAFPTREDLRLSINDNCPLRDLHSKIMARSLPKFVRLLHASGCTLIFVNQMRDKPGIFYGRPDYPTGGKALQYFAALRLEARRYESIRAPDGTINGQAVMVNVRKCKYAAPGKGAIVKLIYGEGLCDDRDEVAARSKEILCHTKAWG